MHNSIFLRVIKGIGPGMLGMALGLGLIQLTTPALAASGQMDGVVDVEEVASYMAQLERSIPAVASMRTHDIESYATILSAVAHGLSQNKPKDQLSNDVRAALGPIFLRKLVQMPDDFILGSLLQTAEEGRSVAETKPHLCAAWVAGGNDVRQQDLPPELARRLLTLQDKMIRATPLPAPNILTEEQFTALIPALLEAVAARTGLSMEILEGAPGSDINGADVCLVMVNFLEAVVELPNQQGALLWRYILTRNEAGE